MPGGNNFLKWKRQARASARGLRQASKAPNRKPKYDWCANNSMLLATGPIARRTRHTPWQVSSIFAGHSRQAKGRHSEARGTYHSRHDTPRHRPTTNARPSRAPIAITPYSLCRSALPISLPPRRAPPHAVTQR